MPTFQVEIIRARKVYESACVEVEARDAEHAGEVVSEQDDPADECFTEIRTTFENWHTGEIIRLEKE